MTAPIFSQWQGFGNTTRRYWKSYGGFSALLTSPYFHIALALTAFTYGYWINAEWWGQTLSILPNLLGFTLGGFAIFLSLGSDDFRSLMAQSDQGQSEEQSPYMAVIGSFVHFVVVQLLAMLVAIIANASHQMALPHVLSDQINSYLHLAISLIGYGLFLYSLILSLSVCFAIYTMSSLFVKYDKLKNNP